MHAQRSRCHYSSPYSCTADHGGAALETSVSLSREAEMRGAMEPGALRYQGDGGLHCFSDGQAKLALVLRYDELSRIESAVVPRLGEAHRAVVGAGRGWRRAGVFLVFHNGILGQVHHRAKRVPATRIGASRRRGRSGAARGWRWSLHRICTQTRRLSADLFQIERRSSW